jgi:hypothetical protein
LLIDELLVERIIIDEKNKNFQIKMMEMMIGVIMKIEKLK